MNLKAKDKNKKSQELLIDVLKALDLKIDKDRLLKNLERTKTKINGESVYFPPKNDEEQIERTSLFLKIFKSENNISGKELVERLPKEYKLTRTALNAYIYGTMKNPPSRDFLITIFKSMGISDEQLDTVLGMCGYKEISGKDTARKLIKELLVKDSKTLKPSSIEKLANRITSMTAMFINEECKEFEKDAITN